MSSNETNQHPQGEAIALTGISEGILAQVEEVTSWRRHLHAHPETAFEEVNTARFIAEKLRSFGGIEVHEGIAGTGVVGVLNGDGDGPSIGLRADIDALDITETNDFAWASTIPGKMHACGHDGHTAMLLGAAKFLAARRGFNGRVVFIFQPAEENEGGARVMIEQGLFERFPVDSAILQEYSFSEWRGGTLVVREPISVCGLITPWNWPLHLISIKVAAAIAAGCPIVLKPSEIAPTAAIILTEVIDASDLPKGGFNLMLGRQQAGAALSEHPDVRLITFTGSVGTGIRVAQAAAPAIKRVVQELGGNAANIVLPDVDLERAVREGLIRSARNSCQSCNAPSRMLVPAAQLEKAVLIAAERAMPTSMMRSNWQRQRRTGCNPSSRLKIRQWQATSPSVCAPAM